MRNVILIIILSISTQAFSGEGCSYPCKNGQKAAGSSSLENCEDLAKHCDKACKRIGSHCLYDL